MIAYALSTSNVGNINVKGWFNQTNSSKAFVVNADSMEVKGNINMSGNNITGIDYLNLPTENLTFGSNNVIIQRGSNLYFSQQDNNYIYTNSLDGGALRFVRNGNIFMELTDDIELKDNLELNGNNITEVDSITGNSDNIRIGTGVDSHSLTSSNDLFVKGKLEVDGLAYFDGQILPKDYIYFGGTGQGTASMMRWSLDNLALGVGTGDQRSFVVTDSKWITKNHDHPTQADPTLFVHSATNPDVDNTEWISMTYKNATDEGWIEVGNGSLTIVGGNDNVRIGDAGTDSHSLTSNDDLYVSGKLEVDGQSYFETEARFYHSISLQDNDELKFGGSYDSRLDWSTNQATENTLVWGLGDIAQSLIFTKEDWRDKDFDHPAQDDPTLFIHSRENPDNDNTLWGSIAYNNDTDTFQLDTGEGSKGTEILSNLTAHSDLNARADVVVGSDVSDYDLFSIESNGTDIVFDSPQNLNFFFKNGDLTTNDRVILPQKNNYSIPTLAFGDGDTGFYEAADGTIRTAIEGTYRWQMTNAYFGGTDANLPTFYWQSPSLTNPNILPYKGDLDTGIGWIAANKLSLIAGGKGIGIDGTQNDPTLILYGADTTEWGSLAYINATDEFKIETNTGKINLNDSLYITSDTGRVGVGRTPSLKFDVLDDRAQYVARFHNDGGTSDRYGIIVSVGTDDNSGTNYHVRWADGDGDDVGFVTSSGGSVTYGTFTANHDASTPNKEGYPYGTVMCINSTSQNPEKPHQVDYYAEPCKKAYDKSVFGVYSSKYENEENLHSIYALGDGHILVTREGGNIEVGDYLTSSSKIGYAMKQDDDVLHSYTIAKATQAVDWEKEEGDTKLISCTYHAS